MIHLLGVRMLCSSKHKAACGTKVKQCPTSGNMLPQKIKTKPSVVCNMVYDDGLIIYMCVSVSVVIDGCLMYDDGLIIIYVHVLITCI